MTDTNLGKDEFTRRFKARILELARSATFEDGSSVADYADEVADDYWQDADRRAEGPEACAEEDSYYWDSDE